MKKFIKAVDDAIQITESYPDRKQLEQLSRFLEDLNKSNIEMIEKCIKTPLPSKKRQASTG